MDIKHEDLRPIRAFWQSSRRYVPVNASLFVHFITNRLWGRTWLRIVIRDLTTQSITPKENADR